MTEQFFLALALFALACREGRRIQQPIPVVDRLPKQRFVKHPASHTDRNVKHPERKNR